MAALHQKPKEVLLVPQPSALSEAEKQLAKAAGTGAISSPFEILVGRTD